MRDIPKIPGPFDTGDIVRIDKPGNKYHDYSAIVLYFYDIDACEVQIRPSIIQPFKEQDLFFETNPGRSAALIQGLERSLLGEEISWDAMRREIES